MHLSQASYAGDMRFRRTDFVLLRIISIEDLPQRRKHLTTSSSSRGNGLYTVAHKLPVRATNPLVKAGDSLLNPVENPF